MTVQPQAHFSLEPLRPVLESNGWDVSLHETLAATREDVEGSFRMVVDRGGRIYLRLIHLAAKPQGKIIRRNGRSYAIHSELRTIKSIATTVQSVAEFSSALSEMMALIRWAPEDQS